MSRAFNLLVLVHYVVAAPCAWNVRNYLYFTAYGCVALLLRCNMSVFWVEANFLEAKSKFFHKLARQVTNWRAKSPELARRIRTWRAKTVKLARAKSGCRARQQPSRVRPAVGSVGGHLARANLTVLARQLDSFGAPSPDSARQLCSWHAPTCEFARAKAREAHLGTFSPCRSVFSTRGA